MYLIVYTCAAIQRGRGRGRLGIAAEDQITASAEVEVHCGFLAIWEVYQSYINRKSFLPLDYDPRR